MEIDTEEVGGKAAITVTEGDGTRTIAYAGLVGDGETLTFDAVEGLVLLEGEDVTPYTTGVFPEVTSEGTTLTYEDDNSSSHNATANASK